MQVILLEKVANLGNFSDIVKVKDGYARNFLIPNRKARRATKQAISEFQARRIEFEKIASEKLAALQEISEKLNHQSFEIKQKSGVDGRLFGSVTNSDIAEVLKKAGYDIEKMQVRLSKGPIKMIGDHKIQIVLHTDIIVDLIISVVSENT
ncbi:MAG: 50S ribosomal protein L9 [Burkholderia sp.]|nr:50S ribosomal protein L9 [Burkholderia sp.]